MRKHKKKQHDELDDNLEIDEDFEFDEDIVDEDETPSTVGVSVDKELRKTIEMIVDEQTKDIRKEQKRLSKHVQSIDKHMATHAKLLETLEVSNKAMMKAMSRINGGTPIRADKSEKDESIQIVEEKRGIIGGTLGAIGGVAHGVVDTVAFVLESTIDLVTLGNARK